MENGQLTGREAIKALLLLTLAIILIGENSVFSLSALFGIAIILYLFIHIISLLQAENKKS